MKEFLQMVALFLLPLLLIGWVYGLAQLAVYLWEWRLSIAFAVAIIVTLLQGIAVFVATPAVFIDDAPGEKK
jgi:hypothetical protein